MDRSPREGIWSRDVKEGLNEFGLELEDITDRVAMCSLVRDPL